MWLEYLFYSCRIFICCKLYDLNFVSIVPSVKWGFSRNSRIPISSKISEKALCSLTVHDLRKERSEPSERLLGFLRL